MSVEIVKTENGLTRVTWKTQIRDTEENETVETIQTANLSSFLPADFFKVGCSYKQTSGCLKTGPCTFNVWLSLTVNEFPDYCHLPNTVWGNVSGCNQGVTHRLKKSANSEEWKSHIPNFIEFPAQPPKSEGVGKKVTRIGKNLHWPILNCIIWAQFEFPANRSELNVGLQLTEMFVNQTYCDVQFCFENNQRIGGHITVLSARSPVFAAEFEQNIEEHQNRQVDILDVKFEIFQKLLHYVYSGRLSTPLSEQDAQSLYVEAEKYDIEDLKSECVHFLLSHIKVDNSVHLLEWAHLQSVDQIQQAALNFIAINGKEICFTKDWASLTKNYPDLCLMATQRMMDSMTVLENFL